MTEEEKKWEEEFEKWIRESDYWDLNTVDMKFAYLQACRKRQEEIERLNRLYNLELERVNKAENQHFHLLFKLEKEKERVKELNADLDESAQANIGWSNSYAELLGRFNKLIGAVEKHKKENVCFGHTPGTLDYELYKVLNEISGVAFHGQVE